MFQNIKTRERFFMLVQNGSEKDLREIKLFLEKDPSRFNIQYKKTINS